MRLVQCTSVLLLALLSACSRDADGELIARGTVEVREVDVAPMAAGRLLTVRVEEGALVNVGDTLAELSAPTLQADAAGAAARLAASRALLRDLEAGADPQDIARAEAELAAREAEAARLATDRDRLRALLDAGAIAPREYEAAATAAAVAATQVTAARELLSLRRAGTRRDRLSAARADVAQAEAQLQGREAANADYVLLAPIGGVVLARLTEPGALVPVGGAVVRLGAVESPWVRIYVPARVLPRLTVGDPATIYPPGAGGAEATGASATSVEGRIVAINPRAEFVTRTALTEDERADLLFGIKVEILDTTGRFKPGMPATVQLRPRGRTP